MRPPGKARRPSIPGVCEGGATQPRGMQRPPNAGGLSLRAAKDGAAEKGAQKGSK
jgi:hypothetical protein